MNLIIKLLCKLGIHIKRYDLPIQFTNRKTRKKEITIHYRPCKYCEEGNPRIDGEY